MELGRIRNRLREGIDSGFSAIRDVVGKKFVTEEIYKKRIAICRKELSSENPCCEVFMNRLECAICGCFVEAKAWLENAECKLGKWSE